MKPNENMARLASVITPVINPVDDADFSLSLKIPNLKVSILKYDKRALAAEYPDIEYTGDRYMLDVMVVDKLNNRSSIMFEDESELQLLHALTSLYLRNDRRVERYAEDVKPYTTELLEFIDNCTQDCIVRGCRVYDLSGNLLFPN